MSFALSKFATTVPRRPSGNMLKVKLGSRTTAVAAAAEEEAEVVAQHEVTTRMMTTMVRSHRAVLLAVAVVALLEVGMRGGEAGRRQQERRGVGRLEEEDGEVQRLPALVRKWTRRMTMTTTKVSYHLP